MKAKPKPNLSQYSYWGKVAGRPVVGHLCVEGEFVPEHALRGLFMAIHQRTGFPLREMERNSRVIFQRETV